MKKISVLAVAYLCLLAQSCDKKKNISADPPLATYSSVAEVFESQRVQHKTLKIDAGTHSYFYGNSGTRYAIYANSLVTADGLLVTGQVDVEVSEWLERGDMIFSKMLPVSNGNPLISGGELNIRITQNGQPLQLKDGAQFSAYVPQKGAADTAMDLYWGTPVQNNAQNGVDWKVALADSSNIEKNAVFVHGEDTIAIFSDSLTMCNIDRILPSAKRVSVNLSTAINGAQADGNTVFFIYALYTNYNALLPVASDNLNNYARLLPDVPVTLVAFTVFGGKFYGGTLSATPASGKNYTITLNATDPTAFKKLLNGL